MKAAQIDLTNYFVSELQFSANQKFTGQSPQSIDISDLQVSQEITPKSSDRREWQITLRVALDLPSERNFPYCFLVEMIGLVRAASSVQEENLERLATINGTSLVFSAAREIVRAVTSRGPFKPILLPTVSFWEAKPTPLPNAGIQPEIEASTVAEKLPKPLKRKIVSLASKKKVDDKGIKGE